MNYEELVKALRDIEKTMFALGTSPINMGDVSISLAYDRRWGQTAEAAAAAIESLQTEIRESMQKCAECGDELAHQMPKRGKWIDDEFGAKCSYCGKYAYWSKYEIPWKSPYCPLCVAKMNDSNAYNALDNAQDGPIITPCRGCSDYDGYGGCKSKGGCARAKMEVQE